MIARPFPHSYGRRFDSRFLRATVPNQRVGLFGQLARRREMADTTQPAAKLTRVDYRADTEFAATASPAVSWATETEIPGWVQAWAELEADGERVRVDGSISVNVAWPFRPLRPRETRRLRVRVAGQDGSASTWSDVRSVRGGHLDVGEWTASMIGLAAPSDLGQPAQLRTRFDALKQVASATLYSTANGVYEVEINGHPVDADTLKPGWTSYQWRLIHETTDVTTLVQQGGNAIGIQLTAGWFAQRYGFGDDATPFYGEQPAAALQLHLEYADGTSEVVSTDATWKATDAGRVVAAGIYAGQHDDLRREQPGWTLPDFDDSAWLPARVDESSVVPTPRIAPPVREVAELHPVARSQSSSGSTILDFGQNLVGRLRVRADLPEGATVTLSHAEILTDGDLHTGSMRGAAATDSFTSAGHAVVWEPEFTFRGFRYASVEGWPGDVPADAITAVVVSSDLERTGWLETGHPLVDRLHESIVWSTRGNFVSLPTDCPQRDERLGWTGDIEVFAPTAATLFDIDGFLSNWLADLAAEQHALDGIVPFVVPNVSGVFTSATAGWGDSAVGVPWTLHQHFDDTSVLERQYPSMKAWVDVVDRLAGERHLWKGGFQFGDWLDPTAPKESPTDAKADKELIATAYFHRSAAILAATAELLERPEDATSYSRLATAIKDAFNREYVTPNGRLSSDAQAAYALAIAFDLAADRDTELRMGEHLAGLVRRNGYRIGTGFLGTPVIMDALTRTGQLETADRLLTQTECPSWLYPVTQGATTTWEAWDALLADGSPSPADTSFNHYAFGAIAKWLYESLAGLSATAPGFREMRIAPTLLPSFGRVSATRITPYGHAAVTWSREEGRVRIAATLPANTSATVQLPDGSEPFTVGSGTHEWTVAGSSRSINRVQQLSMRTDLAQVIEDPDAYAAVLGALERHAPHAAQTLRTRTRWEPGVPLDVEFFILPKAVQSAIDDDLSLYQLSPNA
ncbi:family 78 glycoside hydrolase catalytic domain [Microbacterium sp. B2969]|uniref:alpha-L-rhamnosidase n=1 Tax=Microbacterium alkaliflavum TaxID=3248839 RepID=A0ABW7QCU3_9MICO